MSANIQLSPKHRTWVLVSCILQQFAFLCISFGYGLGLPQIVAGFNKSEYYALVGVVYSLTQAIVAPIVATLGDRLGRKWLNVGSLALMCIFLVMTYFANSFVLFLISWALCGVAVGGFMTGPFLIVMDIYEQKDWGKMSGNLVTALSAGMIVGPIVGGLLVDAGSLRGIFLPPIPFFIVNTGSTTGAQADTTRTYYGVGKSAVHMLTKYAALQYGRQGIRCNAVLPAFTLGQRTLEYLGQEFCDAWLKHAYIRRPGKPEDQANAIMFFATDDSSWVTGQILEVSGGFGCGSPVFGDTLGG